MTPTAPRPLDMRRDLPPWAGAAAGIVGAGAALATGELLSGISSKVPSLVIAVGELFVDKTPGAVVESGIQAAGTNDKPILLLTIVVASLALGAMLGKAARTNPRRADAGFLTFGLFGAWAAQRNPFASTGWAIIAALVAAAVGAITVRALLTIASIETAPTAPTAPAAPTAPGGAPRPVAETHPTPVASAVPARRAFLVVSGGVALSAVAFSAIGRGLRNGRSVESVRSQVSLPPVGAPAASGASAASGAVAEVAGTLDGAVTGLSSYITPNKSFYRIDNALTVPQVDPAKWKLSISGLVDKPYTLTYDEILAMDLVEETVTLSCVSNGVGDKYVGNAVWRGVPLTTILDRAGVQPAGTQIAGISVDDFDASFPTELAYDGRTALLAVGMNGEPLPVIHGFPARLVVAGVYGYVSAVKWLSEIKLVDADYDAYWIPRGWSTLGPIKTQSRIDVPRTQKISAGATGIGGVAWAPTKGIAKVEVQIDDGPWQQCTLGSATSDETWVQWKLDWDAKPGRHVLRVRATDKTGYTQGTNRTNPAPNGAEGQHTIALTVT